MDIRRILIDLRYLMLLEYYSLQKPEVVFNYT